MKVFSMGVAIAATLYIKAETAEEARAKAVEAVKNSALELSPDEGQEIPISGAQYDDPDLPEVSLSPAMTLLDIEDDEQPDEVEDLDEAGDEEGVSSPEATD